MSECKFKVENGLLIIEVAAMLRVPVRFEAVGAAVLDLPESLNLHLTSRESQTLKALLDGRCNKEIAADLNLSGSTIKFHVSSLLDKFKVTTRGELQALFIRDGDGARKKLREAQGG